MPHLIVIEEHESQRRRLEELLSALSKKGYALIGKTEAASIAGGWPAIFAASRSGGLFDAKRTAVVESAEQLGPFPESLAAFLEREDADSVIVAIFGGDSKKSFSKEVLGRIAFLRPDAAVPPWKRKDWLLSLAREGGIKLEPAAAALLAESIESQEELRSELDKLALFAAGAPVGTEIVKNLSFDEGGNALLRFLDSVCQARPKDVLNALKHLQADPSPLPLLTALYNRLRPALYIACFSQRTGAGSVENRALAAIGATREYALRMARNALSVYGGPAVKRFMLSLIRLSYLEKTSAAEGWIGFETALWSLMDEAGGSGKGESKKR
ncbi:MAG: hypothetical protein LBQ90_08495 [Synergistaceae bacterium]|jgi:DNA polymerase-3 subunit delta|nr:hypothetical protein [Synergistaceae bacterium]